MGKLKQLLPIGKESLLERALNETLRSDLSKIVLVLGYHAEDIKIGLARNIQHPKLKVIENTSYKQGISSSIIAGLTCVEQNYNHVMIILGDIPHIDADLINLLLNRYLASHLPIGAIKIKTKRSHPVIFNRRLYSELHKLRGDVGARDLFQKHAGQVCLVEPEGSYDDRDIDTMDDYTQIVKQQQF